ncbi:MAG: nitrilase-related carbon-nitrogen hydrolase [Chthoniobacterales bacterium]
MKIAAAQIFCSVGDLNANLRKIHEFSSGAKEAGAELVVFPEMVDTGYSMPVIRTCATAWTEGAVPKLKQIAKTLSIAIVAGVSEREGACIYNSQVFIAADGAIIAKYRKTHLFAEAPIEEHKCFSPGNRFSSSEYAGLCVGLSICYDLRFPEVYRSLAVEEGANVFAISSAWPFPRVDHFRTLALARAIENQSYVVAANRVGTDDEVSFCGSSTIIDPYGTLIRSGSADREELIHAEVSQGIVQSVRNQMAVFAHRRQELYSKHPA